MRGHQIAVRMAASGPQPEVDKCALKWTVNAAYDPLLPVVPHGSGHFADPPMAVIDRKKVVSAAALPFETIPADLDSA